MKRDPISGSFKREAKDGLEADKTDLSGKLIFGRAAWLEMKSSPLLGC